MVTKSNTVYVGIVDIGIDVTHPDLSNIVDISKSRAYTGTNVSAFGDSDGHGTGVASVVGMATNEIGNSSNNWNVKLVSLKVRNGDTDQYTPLDSTLAAAIDDATDLGIPLCLHRL